MGKGPLIKEPRPTVDNDTDMGGEYYCVPLFPTSFLNTLVVSVGLKGSEVVMNMPSSPRPPDRRPDAVRRAAA